MSELDQLPPDQRAVLSLVLDRGKSYGEVADMLAIPESAVRDRAHAALDALASAPAAPSGSQAASPAASPSRSAGPPPRSTGAQRGAVTRPSSRTAGALLLGGIAAAIVVVVILISSSGGKASSHTPTTTSTSGSSTSTTSAARPTLDKTIALTPAEPALKATGSVYVLSQGKQRAFYVAAQGLPPSSGFFYAVWLFNSPTSSKPLGRAPTVGSNGRMEGGGPLPTNAGSFSKLVITRETSTHPSQPGPIVLSGPFSLH